MTTRKTKMSEENKKKIIVVDDHEFFRKGVVMTINSFDYARVVDEAENGQKFIDLLDTVTPDLVLMDIKMPVMSGIEATKLAIEKNPDLKIIALSMYGEEEYLEGMIKAGVKGFLLKNISRDDLDHALRTILEGDIYYSEKLLPFFTKKFFKKDTLNGPGTLTVRELEILRYLARGLTNREIAEMLSLSDRTVSNHRANLLSKTGSRNTVELLIYSIKNGLVKI
ncbi:MAG TPA: response regulator transcription factor [Bacteroidales bacterium]|nr:response regulator transcription factor [Bacteroidales bacterium]